MLAAAVAQVGGATDDPRELDRLSRLLADHAVLDEGLDLQTLVGLARAVGDLDPARLTAPDLPLTDVTTPDGVSLLRLAPGADAVLRDFGRPAACPPRRPRMPRPCPRGPARRGDPSVLSGGRWHHAAVTDATAARTDPPLQGPELPMLLGFLDYRATLLMKVEGLDKERMNRRLPSSELTLAGLVKHLALVEDTWFSERTVGTPVEPWASAPWDDDVDWDFHSAPDDEPADLVDLYRAACERSRRSWTQSVATSTTPGRAQPLG